MMIVTAGCNANNEIRLTEQDNGRTIALKRNQLLILTLRSPVLPWRWEVNSSKEGIVERAPSEENRRAASQPKDPIPGGQSDETFVFKGIAAGQVSLTFVVRRPDRQEDEAKEGFKVHVNVE
jgi:predicted secreted protein